MRTLNVQEIEQVSGGRFGSIAEAIRGQLGLIRKIKGRKRRGGSLARRLREISRRARRIVGGRREAFGRR